MREIKIPKFFNKFLKVCLSLFIKLRDNRNFCPVFLITNFESNLKDFVQIVFCTKKNASVQNVNIHKCTYQFHTLGLD